MKSEFHLQLASHVRLAELIIRPICSDLDQVVNSNSSDSMHCTHKSELLCTDFQSLEIESNPTVTIFPDSPQRSHTITI